MRPPGRTRLQLARSTYLTYAMLERPHSGGSALPSKSFPVKFRALRLTQEPGPNCGSAPSRLFPCSCLRPPTPQAVSSLSNCHQR